MSGSPVPLNEFERLCALRDLEILDSPAERAFDGLVQAAALVCGVPISVISLVDHARQWFKAGVGLPGVTETPRDIAFCAHAIMQDGIFEVQDASHDARFADNPLVTAGPSIRFYAGAPLQLSDGMNVGTLCVIDLVPRILSAQQRQVLSQLAVAAVSAMECRRTARRLADSEAKFRALSEAAADAIISIDEHDRISFFNASAERMFQCDAESAVGRAITEFVPEGFPCLPNGDLRVVDPPVAGVGHPSSVRVVGRRGDGTEFPIEPALARTYVDDRPIRTAVIRDVSERAELEQRAAQRAFELSAANAQLRLTSDQLRAAQRITHVGSWEFDVTGGEVRWSDELFRIAGRLPSDGVPSFPEQEQLYTPDSWQRLSGAVSECLATGASYELELEFVRLDGERRWTIARGEAKEPGRGGVDFLFGTLQDITELKRAREKEQRASERSQLATRAAGMGVWEWDVEQDSVIWDQTMQQLWGNAATPAEGPLQRWIDMVEVADRAEMGAQLTRVLEGAGDAELSVCVRHADGGLRHMRATATLRRGSLGGPRKVVGVSWDVTEQQNAQAALRANEVLLREFVRHAPAAIAMFDRDMRYLQASERWASFVARPVEQLVGLTHYALFADTPSHWKDMHQRVLAGEALRSDEDAVINADGSATWFEWDAHPWRDPDGRIGGLTWYIKDITDKKNLELALRDQKQALERSREERERANAALQETLTLQRAILDSSGMSIIATDANGRIETFNRAAQRMLNYDEEEMLGNTPAVFHAFDEVVSRSVELEAELGESVPPGFEVFVAKARRGQAEQREWTYIQKGGIRIPVLLSVTPLRGPNGDIYGFLGVAADLREQRHAQTLFEQVSSRLRIATAGAGVGIWEWTLKSNALVWDDQMCRLYGIEQAQRPSAYEHWHELLHADDSARVLREAIAAAQGLRAFDSTFRVLHGDGGVRFIRAYGILERDQTGAPLRLIGTNWDVTKECEAERALAGRTSLLHEFVKHAPAAIAMLDKDLRYLQASDRWLADYHLEGQELVGRSHYEVLPDLPEHWKLIHQQVLGGASARSEEEPVPLKDGEVEWLQWEARPWRTDDSAIGGVVLSTTVITARKLMELRLRRQQAELERSNEELQQFAYVASHDLQEPLRAVAGCAQIFRETYAGKLDEGADELIGHMVDGATRMRSLISDLLSLSRVSSSAPTFTHVDCNAACAEALANLGAALHATNALVQVDDLPSAVGEGMQIVQLFQNLLGNALKYRSSERPVVRVGCETTETDHVYSVSDNGIGIEPQYFERIFGVFQRLHTRTEYEGTGIGLAICSKVIQRHHGRIWVESSAGKGTTFRFSLPREQLRQRP